MNNEEKILSMLEALTADMAAMKTDVAAEIAGVKTGMYSVNADTTKFVTYTISTDNEMSGIKNAMFGLKAEMTGVKAEMSELKTDMAEVKAGMSEVKTQLGKVVERLDYVEESLAETRDSVRKVDDRVRDFEQSAAGIEYEHGKKLDMIYEIVQGNTEKLTCIERDAARHEDSILHHIH